VSPFRSAPYHLDLHVFASPKPPLPWEPLIRGYTSLPEAVRPSLAITLHYHSDYCHADSVKVKPPTSLWNRPVVLDCLETLRVDPTARLQAVFRIRPTAFGSANSETALRPQFLVILEDVDDVSPLWMLWVDYAVRSYLWHGGRVRGMHIGAASLYGPQYNEVADAAFKVPTGPATDGPLPFLLQFPPGWGSVIPASEWEAFTSWHDDAELAGAAAPWTQGVNVPDSYTNRWPAQTSWRKWWLRYMAEHGVLALYPPAGWSFVLPPGPAEYTGHPPNANFPSDRSIFRLPMLNAERAGGQQQLVLAATDAGEDTAGDGDAQVGAVNGGPPVSLAERPWLRALPRLPRAPATLVTLDVYHRPVAARTTAADLRVDVAAGEGCTLIMSVYSRYGTLPDRLRYLSGPSSRLLRLVLVIWNNMEIEPPMIAPGEYRVPVVIKKQARNSMNNRLQPQPEIATNCVVMMDDDFDMPVDVLDQSMRLWHSHHFDRLVGVRGRQHAVNTTSNEYVYVSYKGETSSMVLPSGMIFHRKYLEHYAALPAALTNIVDEVINCEDLLFNILMANVSRAGPVWIDANVFPVQEFSKEGMFMRPSHFNTRSWCLNEFARAFPNHKLPLKCTRGIPRKFVGADNLYLPPARDEIKSVECTLTTK